MTGHRRTRFLVCVLGIFACYFVYAMLQEKITRGQYGEAREKFTHMFALVCLQCLVNYVFAKTISLTLVKQGVDTTRTLYYLTAALCYLLAMVCSNMALRFVNYPTQVVAKAGKPIPVMLLGVLLGRKVYPARKYLFVLLIVIGAALFMYKDNVTVAKQAESQFGFGELLLLLSLLMDGMISAVQERMRAEHKTMSTHMMLNMNFWSFVFSGLVILVSGELFQFLKFIQRHPNCLWHITSFSVAGTFGQYFIFMMVAEFGPLPCSIVTTTRKFFTVLGSVLFFGNHLLPRQWVATFVVFSGLLLDALYGKDNTPKKEISK